MHFGPLSYRLAETKDAAATALEMGNSPAVPLRDYRELTTEAEGKDWFSVDALNLAWRVIKLGHSNNQDKESDSRKQRKTGA